MSLVETVLDLLRIVRNMRAERDAYRQIAQCAIHRLHEQHTQIVKQRTYIRRLRGEIQSLRHGTQRLPPQNGRLHTPPMPIGKGRQRLA
jgi:hypothetical protein